MIEQYTTIEGFKEFQFKEKGSLFIGQAFPLQTEEEATTKIKEIKKKYYDATHHCTAWRLTDNFRYSDDGEPNGTAGIRILNAIDHHSLINVLVVVIRYYGGVKLGVGPLGKAYYFGADETLKETKKICKKLFVEVNLTFSYDYISLVHQLLEKHEAKITDSQFSNQALITALIKPVFITQIEQKMVSLSKGSAQVLQTGKTVYL